MSGNKDCEVADRCYRTYVELVGMMDAGPQKNAMVRDAKAFDEKRQAPRLRAAAQVTPRAAEPRRRALRTSVAPRAPRR